MDSGSVEMRELTESLEQLSVWASRADYNHWNTWQTCVRILTDFAVVRRIVCDAMIGLHAQRLPGMRRTTREASRSPMAWSIRGCCRASRR